MCILNHVMEERNDRCFLIRHLFCHMERLLHACGRNRVDFAQKSVRPLSL